MIQSVLEKCKINNVGIVGLSGDRCIDVDIIDLFPSHFTVRVVKTGDLFHIPYQSICFIREIGNKKTNLRSLGRLSRIPDVVIRVGDTARMVVG